jgi:hypothetical protein
VPPARGAASRARANARTQPGGDPPTTRVGRQSWREATGGRGGKGVKPGDCALCALVVATVTARRAADTLHNLFRAATWQQWGAVATHCHSSISH